LHLCSPNAGLGRAPFSRSMRRNYRYAASFSSIAPPIHGPTHALGSFWGVTLKDVGIGGGSIGSPTGNYGAAGSTIVDSGTTYT